MVIEQKNILRFRMHGIGERDYISILSERLKFPSITCDSSAVVYKRAHKEYFGAYMHSFPYPERKSELFKTWVSVVGDKLKKTDPWRIYKNKKICDHHFTTDQKVACHRLMNNAVPSVYLNGIYLHKITEEHVDPSKIKKMRVKMAAQLFSHSVLLSQVSQLIISLHGDHYLRHWSHRRRVSDELSAIFPPKKRTKDYRSCVNKRERYIYS